MFIGILALLLSSFFGLMLLEIERKSKVLRESQTKVREDLSNTQRSLRTPEEQQAKSRIYPPEIGRIQGTSDSSNVSMIGIDSAAHLSRMAPAEQVDSPRPIPSQTLVLTTNDINADSVRVIGHEVTVALRIPSEEISMLRKQVREVIFAQQVIATGYYAFGLVRRDGTNVGIVLFFASRAEADAVAATLRGQDAQ